ncbi:hypothetical protein [Calditerrivibrio nitroreducens]|uniref:hypothetical protein n=1 Tax=Calditerrivibrio nitroreducens TaxID=477976 RepID=UPI003C71BBDA
MKKIYLIVCLVILSVASYAAVTEEDLMSTTPNQVREQLQQNIRMGMKNSELLNVYGMLMQSRYSNQEKNQILSQMREAFQKGATQEAIANKVGEGLAKNVSADQMVKALNNVGNRYSFAKLIAERITQEEKVKNRIMSNITEALTAGMHEKDVESLMSRDRVRKDKELAAEVSEMARDMVRARINSQDVAKTIGVGIEKGYSAKEMAEIRAMFRNNLRNMNANELAMNMKYGFEKGYKGGQMAGSMSGTGNGGSGGGSGAGSSGAGGSGGSSGSGGGHGGGGKGR